jgi:hypothetical protein
MPIDALQLSDDRREVLLSSHGLVRSWVYAITAAGVRSPSGEAPVHPTGVYTLNEIPDS